MGWGLGKGKRLIGEALQVWGGSNGDGEEWMD